MGNFKKKMEAKLEARRQSYDAQKGNKAAFKRPGSQNPHKQGAAGGTGGKRR